MTPRDPLQVIKELRASLVAAEQRAAEAERVRDLLGEALDRMEWSYVIPTEREHRCPECGEEKGHAHGRRCGVGAALSAWRASKGETNG